MENNTHKKHRQRMRDKYMAGGLNAMAEHEILEMLLYYAIPRKNTNPIAHKIINKFGSLENVLKAEPMELERIPEVGPQSAILIKFINDLILYLGKSALKEKTRLSDISVAGEYIRNFFYNKKTEEFYLFFLDKGERLMSWKCIAKGSVDNINVDIAEVIKEATFSKCVSLILAHNHPGGHLTASGADVATTRRIAKALSFIGVKLKDHIIVSDNQYISLAESSLLD